MSLQQMWANLVSFLGEKSCSGSFGQFVGSYAGAGYLISDINATGPVKEYGRYLDLDQAIARTVWTQGEITYQRSVLHLFISKASYF